MEFIVGSVIKFKDNLWQSKQEIASGGGLFGNALEENAENKFTVARIHGDELLLEGFPWLVYEEELELFLQ